MDHDLGNNARGDFNTNQRHQKEPIAAGAFDASRALSPMATPRRCFAGQNCATLIRAHRVNASGFAGTLLALTLLPLVIGADDAESVRRDANQRRVAEMTPAERRRLEDNWQKFQELPAVRKDQLRELQQAIDQDAELKADLEAYQALANSLSPWQRKQLRQQSDPNSRLRMIEEFRGEPDPLLFPSSHQGGPKAFARPGRRQVFEQIVGRTGGMRDIAPSTARETKAMIDVLERQLPTSRQDQLKTRDPFTRMVEVVQETRQRNRGLPPQFKLFGNPKEAKKDVFPEMLGTLDKGGAAEEFVLNRRVVDQQRFALYMVLMRGLTSELVLTIDEHFPDDDDLRRYFEILPDRQSLLNLPENEWLEQLQLRYLEESIPGIHELRVMFAEMQQSIPDDFMRRPPGGDGVRGFRPNGQPPFGPLDGSRRPDRRPEVDRPPNRPGDERLKNRNEGERPKVLLEEDRPKERRPVGRE